MTSQKCKKCENSAVEVDPLDGFLICTNCGLVLEEVDLCQHSENFISNVDERGQAHGQQSLAPHGQPGVGRESDREHAGHMRHRKQLQDLEGLGSALHMPPLVIQDAALIVSEFRSSDGTTHNVSALLGAALYIAARRAELGIILPEVAAAAAVEPKTLGAHYRSLTRALGIQPPSINLRSYVLRVAAQIMDRYYSTPTSGTSSSGPDPSLTIPGGSQTQGSESQSSLRNHYMVQPALHMAELVSRLCMCEGKTMKTLAGAVLVMITTANPPVKRGKPSKMAPDQLYEVLGVKRQQVVPCMKMMKSQLVDLAKQLPFGASINTGNVLHYLPTLSKYCSALIAVKKKAAEASVAAEATRRSDSSSGAQAPELSFDPRSTVPSTTASARPPAPMTSALNEDPVAICSAPSTSRTLVSAQGSSELNPVRRESVRGKRDRDSTEDGHEEGLQGGRKTAPPHCTSAAGGSSDKVSAEAREIQPAFMIVLSQDDVACESRLGHGAAWRPLEGEEDDARAILGLMTMEEVREERRRAAQLSAAADPMDIEQAEAISCSMD
ncbi:hypothetical protein CEUSTIGMA_g3150.t1 [Chlamydomonas eustigma]|uniref:TFIIB-type domain-containing protein n=1 Tax=Chlamydomonas eustigma TaxID=1157962 RepID=A0A250WXZ8_9CHLO|nr:hypothetical protein CEUSTIGMA_g3150.t1 [Chlamydomonas eustigma]|eukprot:GAX75707.1 hypothetical protein CEUSTIGMA_g3150.t1 [Chlamydomonas eustigma]